jgi:hypothetical protein
MNILIDTNIIIPLEPGSLTDLEINTDLALPFHKLVQKSENVIHPLAKVPCHFGIGNGHVIGKRSAGKIVIIFGQRRK